ncbi:MAG: FeoA family protein [Pirellulaceae bacterium]
MINRTHADELIPLDRLSPGQIARIACLVGCPEHVRRLEEMGLRPGITVRMVRRGRPCIVCAGGNRLCFRCSDLLGIMVHSCHVTN